MPFVKGVGGAYMFHIWASKHNLAVEEGIRAMGERCVGGCRPLVRLCHSCSVIPGFHILTFVFIIP